MYLKTQQLIDFLYEWRCFNSSFYECVIDLSKQMGEKGFWHPSELNGIRNWLDDLRSFGYQEPQIVLHREPQLCLKGFFQEAIHFKVRYTPQFQKSLDLDTYCCNGTDLFRFNQRFESFNYLYDFCLQNNNVTLNYSMNKLKQQDFLNSSSYELLITFNWAPRIENIILIKHIYGTKFRNIIFCGKGILSLLNETILHHKIFDSYTFIELDLVAGYFHYYCMTKLIEMNYNIQGILLMSDDVLLKYWNLEKNYNLSKILFLDYIKEIPLNSNFTINWIWWSSSMGKAALFKLFDHFYMIQNESIKVDQENKIMVENFLKRLNKHKEENSGFNFTSIFYQGSDFFYLPKSKFRDFHFFSNLFRRFSVFLEIAVPTILFGIDYDNTARMHVNHTYYWGSRYYFQTYDNIGEMVHPAKLSEYKKTKAGSLFCSYFIQDKFNNDLIY
jgi:hypothetical protein